MKSLLVLVIIFSLISVFANEADFDQIRLKRRNFKESYLDFAEQNSHNKIGEIAFLELAKIEVLNRNYEKAIQYLETINSPDINEKHYWLAKSYLEAKKYHRAIIAAQNFITESDDYNKTEITYLLIAEAYINQEMYKRALNTLETLRNSKYINNNISLLHFKIGYCNELMGKYEMALSSYKKVKQDFPYTQMSYKADDRIGKIIYEENIDAKKLELLKEKPTKAETGRDMKIYLQVGAFGSDDNAQQLSKRVADYGYKVEVFSKIKNSKKLFVVAVGPFNDDTTLKRVSANLKKMNITSFILKRY